MLRKLSIQIVLINMVLVGMILVIVFSGLCYTNYRSVINQLDEDLHFSAMKMARMNEASSVPTNVIGKVTEQTKQAEGQNGDLTLLEPDPGMAPDDGNGRGYDSMDMTPAIVVKVSEDGDILAVYNERRFNISEETISNAVDAALAQGDERVGRYKDGAVFYKKVEVDGGTYVALTGSVQTIKNLHRMVVFSIFGWLLFMLFFLVISITMTRFTLKPVRRSWEQQQQFVADASHELKTPLTVILANNSILAEDPSLTDDSRVWVDSTQEEAQHMQTLINHLLYLARSDSGSQKMILQDLPLSDMVFEDVLQFEPVAFERGIVIDSDLADDVHLEGDATMVKQLIHILMDNACKYASDNGTVTVSLKRVGKGALLTVNNPGTPIPPEDLPHIFERFYRSDKSRTLTENAGGYGLGLAIAQSIAKDHNAQISCKSSEQDGTTFFVQFKEILK